MKTEKIVMFDAPEAASIQTVTGWVSRNGFFYGDNEDFARHDGCTHVACRHCGEPTKKSYIACDACRKNAEISRYAAMPRAPWDGVSMLYSQEREEFYSDMDAVYDVIEDGQTIEEMRLVICMPNYPRRMDESYFENELYDDSKVPKVLMDAIDAFNDAVAAAPVLSWSPGGVALDTMPIPHRPKLWAILVPGPDDVWAMPSKKAAEEAAEQHNKAIEKIKLDERFDVSKDSVQAIVIEWPHDAESHADELAELEILDQHSKGANT